MTNPYFTNTIDLLEATRARASDVESNFSAVEAGFDGVNVDMLTKAPLASPALTGTPTTTTPLTGDTSTRVANMAAVQAAIGAAAALNLPASTGDGKSLIFTGGVPAWGNWFGLPTTLTSTTTLTDRRSYFLNSTAGAFSLTLPASPVVGESWVRITDIGGALVTNNVSLLPGSNTVMGLPGTFLMNTNYFPAFLVFTSSKGWVFA